MSDQEAQRPDAAPRRRRGAAESLGQIVLVFETLIVFLAGLVVFGLKVLPEGVADWWGIVAGAIMAVLMLATCGVLRYRWGIVVGWALQVALALAAFLVPAILLVALVFGAMWGYATIKGASLDRRNAQLMREAESANGE
ncbi:DUF4233 domain-containing protein [Microbacterium protaetiae]|uniref:DUF4233 domain-containing protein n=1 Tax=Microbacterium protaetiae TaxID=2509458 RepID=UPI001F5C5B3C|nr:DUF4233 domain-containing protein [Microbacterium protaetiae]